MGRAAGSAKVSAPPGPRLPRELFKESDVKLSWDNVGMRVVRGQTMAAIMALQAECDPQHQQTRLGILSSAAASAYQSLWVQAAPTLINPDQGLPCPPAVQGAGLINLGNT